MLEFHNRYMILDIMLVSPFTEAYSGHFFLGWISYR